MNPDAVGHARTQLGVKEATGRNDGDPWRLYMPHSMGNADRNKDGKPDVGLPWCAGFVLEMYRRAGTPLERSVWEKWHFCRVATMWFSLVARGWQTTDPTKASLLFLRGRGESDKGRGSHVAMVESFDDGIFETIEGNLSNGVRRFRRVASDADILGLIAVP